MACACEWQLSFFLIETPPHPEWGASAHIDREWICLSRDGAVTRLLPIGEVQLRGRHNLANAVAACAIAQATGLSQEAMTQAVRSFRGVAHRLEWVARFSGVDWYNDSIATAPERAIAAMRSLRTDHSAGRHATRTRRGRVGDGSLAR
jgi:UDP-N-acetylmuramoylalanine--D-glutamate ligase